MLTAGLRRGTLVALQVLALHAFLAVGGCFHSAVARAGASVTGPSKPIGLLLDCDGSLNPSSPVASSSSGGGSSSASKSSGSEPVVLDASPANPCATDNGGCAENEVCKIAGPGKSKCSCKPGFGSPDGLSCKPLCDCNVHNGGCGPHKCVCHPASEPGAIQTSTCECARGFELVKGACTQVDPCDRCRGDPHAVCIVGRSFVLNRCACTDGYTFDSHGVCVPMDPCEENGGCPPGVKCIKIGANQRRCQPVCENGKDIVPGTMKCQARDPCKVNNGGCSPFALCEAAPEAEYGRRCYCKPPSVGDGELCLPPCKDGDCPACRLAGKCGNGKEDLNKCECKCISPWVGRLCNTCPIHCKNGGSTPKGICGKCTCPSKWMGDDCTICNPTWPEEDCPAGQGMVDTDSCTCQCVSPWRGPSCSECTLVPTDCKNGGVLNTATCRCEDCDSNWEGLKCDQCALQVLHGGKRTQHCKAECINLAKGNKCEVCDVTCRNGGILDPAVCMCKQCPEPWTGISCQTCMLSDRDCLHGGYMDKETCKCVGCQELWTGDRCDQCIRSISSCQNEFNGWDDETCSCQCGPKWKGTFCDVPVCGSPLECQNGGVWDAQQCKCVACSAPWGGDKCQKCLLTPQVCQSKGGELDASRCVCTQCANFWSGRSCSECMISHCLHGFMDTVDGKSQCRCKCNKPWRGGENEGNGMIPSHAKPEASFIGCNDLVKKCGNGAVLQDGECICPGLWRGELCDQCKKEDCANGGKMDMRTCTCHQCPAPWDGDMCRTCMLDDTDCKNGGILDRSLCKCKFCGGRGASIHQWGGAKCDECILRDEDCVHGGKVDKITCDCSAASCSENWKGALCDEQACTAPCEHDGKLDDKTCKCSDCQPVINAMVQVLNPAGIATSSLDKPQWGGDKCHVCQLDATDCGDRGTFDPFTCKCRACNNFWRGDLCQFCQAPQCLHGSRFDPETCSCIDCPATDPDEKDLTGGPQWVGKRCEKCNWDQSVCKNGGHFDKETCTCQNCAPREFSGKQCQQCSWTDSMCSNGGTLDASTCSCKCPKQWAGSKCEQCGLAKTSRLWLFSAADKCNHGTLDLAKCECTCTKPWSKESDGSCSRCSNDLTLLSHPCAPNKWNSKKCECSKCEGLWKGKLCDQCDTKKLVCDNGGKPNIDTCRCEGCNPGYGGDRCDTCTTPIDCVVEQWAPWDNPDCAIATCPNKKGMQKRTRAIKQEAVCGGKECPATVETVQCTNADMQCERPPSGCPPGEEFSPSIANAICHKKRKDIVLVVDKSGSMRIGSRWSDALSAADLILQKTVLEGGGAIAPLGIDVIMFDSKVYLFKNVKTRKELGSIFKNTRPKGGTAMSKALAQAFDRRNDATEMSVLVITDGRPNKQNRVRKTIREEASSVLNPGKLKISFVQVGTDRDAATYLDSLDTDLNAAYDIVDKVSYSDVRREKVPFVELFHRWFECRGGLYGCQKCRVGSWKARTGNHMCEKCSSACDCSKVGTSKCD